MNRNVKHLAPRALYESKFTSARYNLLLVVGMTLINIVMLFLGGSSYFLFSATIPYSLSIDAAYYTGRLPDEYYLDWPESAAFLSDGYLVVMLGIALAILAVYLCCFLFSKKFKNKSSVVTIKSIIKRLLQIQQLDVLQKLLKFLISNIFLTSLSIDFWLVRYGSLPFI